MKRAEVISSKEPQSFRSNFTMLSNFLKILLRTIRKDKVSYALNFLGLAAGVAAFFYIFVFVITELGFDSFHEKKNRIYRVNLSQYENGYLKGCSAENYPAVGPALVDNFPEVLSYTRLYNAGAKNNVILTSEEGGVPKSLKVKNFLYADSLFFSIFSFPISKGDLRTSLAKPNSAAISESFARRMYGQEDPVGKILRMTDDDFNDETCVVTAVFEDTPPNSHLNFDVLFSYSNLLARNKASLKRFHESWDRKDMYTYILLHQEANAELLASNISKLVDAHNADLDVFNRKDELVLQGLRDIHLDNGKSDEPSVNGSRKIIYYLIVIAALVLSVAMINFLNYAVVRTFARAKEIAVRKIYGGNTKSFTVQLLSEAALITLAGICLAAIMVMISLPYITSFIMQYDLFQVLVSNVQIIIYALLIVLFIGIVSSGLLPLWILNRLNTVDALKGRMLASNKGAVIRNGITVFQLSCSTGLTILTFVVFFQMRYVSNFDLGINTRNMIVIDRPGLVFKNSRDRKENLDIFKEQLLKHSFISHVTGSTIIPGKEIRMKTSIENYGNNSLNPEMIELAAIDQDFIETFELKMLAGRNFSNAVLSDRDTAIMISETTARKLGFHNPEAAVGKRVTLRDFSWNPMVVGVIKDFHQLSLKQKITSQAFIFNGFLSEYYFIKINPADADQSIQAIKKVWENVFPGAPFQYYYLEDFYNDQYKRESNFNDWVLILACIAIIISNIGIFNISMYSMIQRTREIAIRKVCGARPMEIGWFLTKGYLKLILIAIMLSFPLAYMLGDQWLSGFAYRTSISGWYFAFSALIVLLISLVMISAFIIKSSMLNPVKWMRVN